MRCLEVREGNGVQPGVFTCSAVSVVSVSDCVLFQRMAQDRRFTHVVRQSVGLHPRCKALGIPNGNHLSKRCTTNSSTANCFREDIVVGLAVYDIVYALLAKNAGVRVWVLSESRDFCAT